MTKVTWVRWTFGLVAALVGSAALTAADTPAARPAVQPAVPGQPKIKADSASHTQVGEIKVKSTDGKYSLQTLSIDGEGRVLALAAPPRSYGVPAKDVSSELQIYTPDGKQVKAIKIEFHANSVNAGPDGSIYVAGDGKVVRFDKDGKELAKIALPHIAELMKDDGEIRKQAEAQVKQQKESFEKARDNIKAQKAKIEDKKEADRTDIEKRQLQQFEQILKSYETYLENLKPDNIIAQSTARLRTINGVAINDKDIFVVCGEVKGYGYAVWRMTHDFKEPKQILTAIGGCCGQMDIQCCGKDLVVAENTKHSWAKYDRDGKEIGRFGKRGTEIEGDCFGGCCNPMNLRCVKNDVYTAESEGIIKRYSADGKFQGVVAVAALTGGCKNVALAASADGDKVYFCDQPGSRVIILARKDKKSE